MSRTKTSKTTNMFNSDRQESEIWSLAMTPSSIQCQPCPIPKPKMTKTSVWNGLGSVMEEERGLDFEQPITKKKNDIRSVCGMNKGVTRGHNGVTRAQGGHKGTREAQRGSQGGAFA